MFFTADMLIAHAIGDYVIQSDYMAQQKTSKHLPAILHAFTYTIPFLFLTQNPLALAFIMITHFIIDRWRLARYVCWAKNFLQPRAIPSGRTTSYCEVCNKDICGDVTCADHPCGFNNLGERQILVRNYPWSECSVTGYHKDRPPWLAFWLLIITDNLMHILCNGFALHFLG